MLLLNSAELIALNQQYEVAKENNNHQEIINICNRVMSIIPGYQRALEYRSTAFVRLERKFSLFYYHCYCI